MTATVLFIVGPTASGKTAAALDLAARARPIVRIEIVNADSRQVYRGMSVGAAKPSPADLAAVPHHLIDVAAPDDPYSLARFLADARAAISAVEESGAVPVVVGGTGQYVWGLAEGWDAPAVPPDAALRAELQAEAERIGALALHDLLRAMDPDAADAIDPRNVRRVIRAIEVCRATGEPFSRQRRRAAPEFAPVILALAPERGALRERADARADAMLRDGWIEEVRELLRRGYGPDLPAFSAVGYREVAAHVRGELTLDETAERVKTATHRLIRRQRTWFKPTDARIQWSADGASLVEQALPLLRMGAIR